MDPVEKIIQALGRLTPQELAQFEAWYDKFSAALFDAKIARDSLNGTLDKLAEKSLADFRAGRCREL